MTGPLVILQPVTEFKSVHLRHHHVADNDIGDIVNRDVPSFLPVCRFEKAIFCFEVSFYISPDVGIIFDNEDDRFVTPDWIINCDWIRNRFFNGCGIRYKACFIFLLFNRFLTVNLRSILIVDWYANGKGCSFSLFTVDLNRSFVQFDQFLGECQSYSGPLSLPRVASIDLEEPVEDICKILLWDSDAGIADMNDQIIIIMSSSKFNNTVFRCEFKCIREQIGYHPLDFFFIKICSDLIGRCIELQRDIFSFSVGGKRNDDRSQ